MNVVTEVTDLMLVGNVSPIISLLVLDDGRVAGGAMNGSIFFWNLNDFGQDEWDWIYVLELDTEMGRKVKTLHTDMVWKGNTNKGVSSMGLMSNGRLVSGCQKLIMWDLQSGTIENILNVEWKDQKHRMQNRGFDNVFGMNNDCMVSIGWDGRLLVWQ